jgi:hypothetical protein
MTLHHIELQLTTTVETFNLTFRDKLQCRCTKFEFVTWFVIYYCTLTMKSSNEVGSKVELDNSN